MAKASLAAILAALVIGLTPDVAQANSMTDYKGYPDCADALVNPTDGQCRAYVTAMEFSLLDDEERWAYYEAYGLPTNPPEGYTWSEDLSLVPLSYYGERDAEDVLECAFARLPIPTQLQQLALLDCAH